MDKLKQNPFWVGIGAAGVALVAVFALLVYPQWDQKSTLENQIKATAGSLGPMTATLPTAGPGEPDVATWLEIQKSLKEHHQKIAKFYLERDGYLEVWFDQGTKPPSRGSFMGKYADARRDLEKVLKDKKIALGIKDDVLEDEYNWGFNWEIPGDAEWSEIGAADETAVMSDLQKRFWIRKRITNACVTAGVLRLRDVRFMKMLHVKIKIAKWDTPLQAPNDVKYPADPIAGLMAGGRDKFTEFNLPGKLGKTITFGVTVDLMYTDVPKFIEALLSTTTDPNLLVNIIGCRVSTREQNEPKVPLSFIKSDPPDEKKDKEEADKVKKKFQETVKPKSVQLSITCQVIDVDAAQIEGKKAQP